VFFTRPIAMWLAAATLVIVTWPLFKWQLQRQRIDVES
jgi:hypothetical protein